MKNSTQIKRSANFLSSKCLKFRSKNDLITFISRMKATVNNSYTWPKSLGFILKASDEEIEEILNLLNLTIVYDT